MRKLRLIMGILLLTGCISKEYSPVPPNLRSEKHAKIQAGPEGRKEEESFEESIEEILDTAIYVSAVEVPPSYDWRRDTACGCVQGQIVLLRNFQEVLRLDCGAAAQTSLDPDMHHIIQGHLYTEYSTKNRTIIKRDGETIADFEGREYMKGILCSGDSLFTLGQNRSGAGFSFRLNGEPLLVKKEGTICGGFGEKSFDDNGALFMTKGSVYFKYSLDSKIKTVIDGVDDRSNIVSDGRGHSTKEFTDGKAVYDTSGEKMEFTYSKDCMILGKDFHPNGGYYFFPVGGGCWFGGVLYLGLTPQPSGGKPIVWTRDWSRELDMNGFITGVAVYEETTR